MSRNYANYSQYLGSQRCCNLKGVGPRGLMGPVGPAAIGPIGYTGYTGPTGKGCRGPTGPAGSSSGIVGPTGPTGSVSLLGVGTGSVLLNGTDGIYYSQILNANNISLDICGNFIPTQSNVFSLGYTGSRWKEVFYRPWFVKYFRTNRFKTGNNWLQFSGYSLFTVWVCNSVYKYWTKHK